MIFLIAKLLDSDSRLSVAVTVCFQWCLERNPPFEFSQLAGSSCGRQRGMFLDVAALRRGFVNLLCVFWYPCIRVFQGPLPGTGVGLGTTGPPWERWCALQELGQLPPLPGSFLTFCFPVVSDSQKSCNSTKNYCTYLFVK